MRLLIRDNENYYVSKTVTIEVVAAPSVAWKRTYFIRDHLGSVRVAFNEEGEVVEATDYYPFGLEMPTRSFVSGTGVKENYTGHELDSEIGLLYAGARYYDPVVARWTTVDPLAGKFPGWSPYSYVMGNPLLFIDPDGRKIKFVGSASEEAHFRRYVRNLRTTRTGRRLYDDLDARKEVVTIRFRVVIGTATGITHADGVVIGGKHIVDAVEIDLDVADVAGRTDQTQEGVLAHELQHASDVYDDPAGYAEDTKDPKQPHEKRAEETRHRVEDELERMFSKLKPLPPVPIEEES